MGSSGCGDCVFRKCVGSDEQARAAYIKARKDGGWDEACERAYAAVTGARFAKLGYVRTA